MKIKISKIVAVGLLLAPLGAQAIPVIYDWTGTCTAGCTGQATGVLTLADSYVPGAATSSIDDFVSWSFSSDLFTLTQTRALSFQFIPATFSMVVGSDGSFFDNSASWAYQSTDGTNAGFGGSFTLRSPAQLPVPVAEPGVLALLGLGLAGVTIGRNRKRRQSTAS